MKNFIRASMVLVALYLVAPAQAMAQGMDQFGFHPYLGVGVGMFNLDAGYGSANAAGFFVDGGADFNQYLGAELRLGTTAKASVTFLGVPTDLSIDYFFSYYVKPRFPVNDQLDVYALLGGTTLKTKASGPGGSLTNTSTDFSYGAGIQYKVIDQWKLGAEWVRYAKDANLFAPTFPGLDAYGISATLNYAF